MIKNANATIWHKYFKDYLLSLNGCINFHEFSFLRWLIVAKGSMSTTSHLNNYHGQQCNQIYQKSKAMDSSRNAKMQKCSAMFLVFNLNINEVYKILSHIWRAILFIDSRLCIICFYKFEHCKACTCGFRLDC
jgi:hypothetical protein